MNIVRKKSIINRPKANSLTPESSQSISMLSFNSNSLERKSSLDNVETNKYKTIRSSIMNLITPKEDSKTEQSPAEELRKRASERYCLELVLFKEDYERLKQITNDKDAVQRLIFEIWKKYFCKNCPNEINIPARLADKLRRSILKDEQDLTIMDEIYKEVIRMLSENDIIISQA
eukprot:NODE_31_length_37178_cov_0.413576.p25 type:complete len:175 gc:universal NODE_31_length_37178_cov_0.413576:33641-34165(+)